MVIHIRQVPSSWKSDSNFVYIGRGGKGLVGYFGNPIIRGSECSICGEVHRGNGETLPCYEIYLRQRLEEDLEFRERILKTKDKVLVCFCKPSPCHGDIIEKVRDELLDIFVE